MISHLVTTIKCVNLNTFIRLFIETGLFINFILSQVSTFWVLFTLDHFRLLSSFTLASYHVVTTLIIISTFALHNYSPLFTWMFISSYANALGHLVFFTLLLNLSRVSSFHCSFHHFIVHLIICQITWPFSVSYTHT